MSMLSKRIHVLDVDERKSKAGNPYWVAQCVVYDQDNKPKVGELWHFNKELPLVSGEFTAQFEVDVNMERKVDAKLVSMVPYKHPAPATAKA